MLPATPNRTTPTTIREGNSGWPVFALQAGLVQLGLRIVADGAFGPKTDAAVKAFQAANSLIADGLAGPATQGKLVALIERAATARFPNVPHGLLRGFAELEGGNMLGAVNWTVAGGVDCGILQWRVYGPPYSHDKLRAAYHPVQAMTNTALELEHRYGTFRKLGRTVERSWRLAALGHNWPYAADQLGRTGRLPNPDSPAGWVPAGVKFPDGTPVRTRMQWCEFYALSGPHGEARATKYVTSWT